MAARQLIGRGVGFAPGAPSYMILLGLSGRVAEPARRRTTGLMVEPNRLMGVLLALLLAMEWT